MDSSPSYIANNVSVLVSTLDAVCVLLTAPVTSSAVGHASTTYLLTYSHAGGGTVHGPPDVQRSATVPSQWLQYLRGTACRRLSGMHRR